MTTWHDGNLVLMKMATWQTTRQQRISSKERRPKQVKSWVEATAAAAPPSQPPPAQSTRPWRNQRRLLRWATMAHWQLLAQAIGLGSSALSVEPFANVRWMSCQQYTHRPSSIKSNRMAETAVSLHCISLIESIATNLHRILINANFIK